MPLLSIFFRLHNIESTISSWISSLLFSVTAIFHLLIPAAPVCFFQTMAVSVFLILRRDGASVCCLLYKNFKKPSLGPVLLTITMSHYSLGLLASWSGGTEGSICHSLPFHSTWLLMHLPALALCYSHQEWRFGLVPPWHMQHPAQCGGGGRSGDKKFTVVYDPRAPTAVQIGAGGVADSFAPFHHSSFPRESSCPVCSLRRQSRYKSLRVTAHLSKVNGDNLSLA